MSLKVTARIFIGQMILKEVPVEAVGKVVKLESLLIYLTIFRRPVAG
jgi:hypothetical protein